MERRIVNPWTWQDQMGFVQVNEVSGARRTIFLSGQTSVDEESRPVHLEDMRAQIEQAMDNLETVLREAGVKLSDVVRLNYYTTDVDRFAGAYGAAAGRLAEAGSRPASTLLAVQRLAFRSCWSKKKPGRWPSKAIKQREPREGRSDHGVQASRRSQARPAGRGQGGMGGGRHLHVQGVERGYELSLHALRC